MVIYVSGFLLRKSFKKLAKPFIALLQDGTDARTETTLVSFRGRSISKP